MTRIGHTFPTRVIVLAAAGVLLLLAWASPAFAATAFTEPTGNPYAVAIDAQGKPVPFTVAASGFPLRTAVFVEQCDGRAPTEPNWSPTVDCDIASSQAPAYADSHGIVRFPATDPSLVLRAFAGPSPQGIFNCLPPGAPSPKNGLPDFRTCQIRVSSNATAVTSDQAFLPIVLGAAGSSSSGSSHTALWITLGAVAVAIVAVVMVVIFRRRAPSR